MRKLWFLILLAGCSTPNVEKYPYGKAIILPQQAQLCSATDGTRTIIWSCK